MDYEIYQNETSGNTTIKNFQSYRAHHPLMVKAVDEVINCILNSPYPVTTVFGPAGVGKSKGLIPEVERHLNELVHKNTSQTYGHNPCITVRAPAQSRRTFNWRDFYARILESGGHPLIHRIQDKSESGYAKAVRKMLTCRQSIALIVDEAQHLTNVTPWAVSQQLDCMKDLVEGLNVHVVLVGNYQLLNYPFAGDQIGRRNNTPIHFSRYRLDRTIERTEQGDRDKEAADFMSIVYSFEKQLPILNSEHLYANWKYFYDLTLGCTGLLKDWLEHALRQAIAEHKLPLSFEYIQKFAPVQKKVETLLKAINEHEEKAESIFTQQEHEDQESEEKSQSRKGKNTKHKNSPGVRKPKRDPTGNSTENLA